MTPKRFALQSFSHSYTHLHTDGGKLHRSHTDRITGASLLCMIHFILHLCSLCPCCPSVVASALLPSWLCPFSLYLFFSVHLPSVSLLDRGPPVTEMQAEDLPLPQVPHPVGRHSVPSWYGPSGLWSRLCPQSDHPTLSLLHPLRLCLAEKERVLHREPAAGSLWYSRTAVCRRVTESYSSKGLWRLS